MKYIWKILIVVLVFFAIILAYSFFRTVIDKNNLLISFDKTFGMVIQKIWELISNPAIFISIMVVLWVDKIKDNYARQMDKRKELYTQTHNLLSLWFSTIDDEESLKARDKLLESYRNYQIWASDDVFFSFKKFLTVAVDKNSNTDVRDSMYKNLVLEMRKDLLGRNTKVTIDDIEIRGVQKIEGKDAK
jgi:hypothetical protein